MAVTGCKKWYLAALVLGEGFYVFEIERDEDEIKALMQSEADFWQCVKTETPPMTDGTRATSEAIGLMYPESREDEGAVDLTSYESELQQYMALSAQIKELEELKEEKANRIKAFMGDSGKGDSGLYRVSYTSAERNTFDAKRYAKEHPEANLAPYYKKSSYRTFKITEKKEN
jgi:predicted phage-related endonuclease